MTVTGDDVDEPNETFTVTLSNASGATLGGGTATGTITDDDGAPAVTLVVTPPSIGENGGVSAVTAILDRPSSATTMLTVSAAPVDPAVAGDYALSGNPVLTVPSRSLTSTGLVTVTAVDNGVDAVDREVTISATATNSHGITPPGDVTLTIADDDGPTVTIADAGSVVEGGTLAFPVRLSYPSVTPITVRCVMGGMATRDEDYTDSGSDTVTFPAGTTTQTISLTTMDDELDETDETVMVTLIDADDPAWDMGTPSTATGMIMDNDLPAVTVAAETPAVTEGAEAVFVLTRAGLLSDELTVTFTVAGGDAVLTDAPPTAATFEAGADTARVTLATEDDLVDEADAGVTLTLRPGPAWTPGNPHAATVTVLDDDGFPAVTVTAVSGQVSEANAAAAPGRITEGEAAQFELKRTGDLSVALTVTVTVSERGADMVPTAQEGTRQETFEPGASTTVLQVTTADDGIAEPDSRVTVSVSRGDGSYEVGDPGSATVTVADAGGDSVLAQGRQIGAASLLRRHVERFSQLTSDVALGRLEGNARTSTGDVRVDQDGVAATGVAAVGLLSGWDGWTNFRYSRLSGSSDGDVWDVYAGADYLSMDGPCGLWRPDRLRARSCDVGRRSSEGGSRAARALRRAPPERRPDP